MENWSTNKQTNKKISVKEKKITVDWLPFIYLFVCLVGWLWLLYDDPYGINDDDQSDVAEEEREKKKYHNIDK